MTLQDILQQGWADHDSKTAEVADRLEDNLNLVTSNDDAAGFMNLTIHAVGDHLGDRARAARLCEAAIERLEEEPASSPLLFLSVARKLAGDDAGAGEAQARMGDDPAVPVRVGLLVAQGLMHGGDWDGAARLYREQVATAATLDEGHSGERAAAIVSNNVAGELLRMETRTEEQGALMELAAQNARTYWLRVGTWVNDERADFTLSCVYTKLGRAADARMHAERGLATIAEHDSEGNEKVDKAFLHLACATAYRDLGQPDEQATSIAQAEEIAKGFEADWLVSWFQEELAKAR